MFIVQIKLVQVIILVIFYAFNIWSVLANFSSKFFGFDLDSGAFNQ